MLNDINFFENLIMIMIGYSQKQYFTQLFSNINLPIVYVVLALFCFAYTINIVKYLRKGVSV